MENMHINNPYGILLNQEDLKLQRHWFKELCLLQGVNCLYYAPRPDKHWTNYGEIESNYYKPQLVGTIFSEYPDQKTMKKLGWNAELNTSAALISVPYDLAGLQKGSLFYIPSAFDNTSERLFRVTELSSIMIYPASITCQLVPEYENTFSQNLFDHKRNSFNLLRDEED